MDYSKEITTDFEDIPTRLMTLGEPIFKAFGCVVFERTTENGYVYIGASTKTYGILVLNRCKTFISPNDTKVLNKMLEKLQQSPIAGYSSFSVDRKFGEQLTLSKCKEIMASIFHQILPKYGYTIRDEQISLAEEILSAINNRKIMFAEAEVGTGKTLAYLIAAILAKRSRMNDFWNKSLYRKMQYSHMAHMPIVIATSSIALQKAIVTDYIPKLSNILLAEGIINTPITAVVRKGREHYLCEHKLREYMKYEINPDFRTLYEIMLEMINSKSRTNIDLSEIPELNAYKKSKLSIPKQCDRNCPYRENCAYLSFREQTQSRLIDIQVCNHQYLLADALRRADDIPPLIPNYQSLIIDEAHKFHDAAQSMYGLEFSSEAVSDITNSLDELKFIYIIEGLQIRKMAKKLFSENRRLFRELVESQSTNDDGESETDHLPAVISNETIRHLRNISAITVNIINVLDCTPISERNKLLKIKLIKDLENLQKQVGLISKHQNLIYWLEMTSVGVSDYMKLCALPKDLDEKLYDDLWSKGIPTILTSGTLSANKDFSHIKNQLGVKCVSNYRLSETIKPSPFDYFNNTLLYISENVPFPNNQDYEYIFTLANEIEELLLASHGHAAVLFTSYRAMDMVFSHLEERAMPFPIFRMGKGRAGAIEKFKQSGNGVLFASGSMWEGIDIPGDTLSMLIIVKLPFSAPDPISEYEQTQYSDMFNYKNKVIVPEMLIKLKQGFGRLIRSETDTGVVAILDSRANRSASYHGRVMDTLPICPSTSNIDDIEAFFFNKKPIEYFK